MPSTLSSPRGVDRREFLRGVGIAGVGLALGGCRCPWWPHQPDRPIRRRLRSGSAEVDAAIATYERAVAAMRALPSGDPRSWAAQAAIHGTVSGGFNFCQHGTEHFFSWHRAYLLYFEQICQELTGDDSFGLPYWNWNQEPDIHPAFLDPSSPLFHPRDSTSVAGEPAFEASGLDPIFADGNFLSFGSQIEGSPHNLTHIIVGADMVTGGSPLDPIFWMHHCMVDYCWAKWNQELNNSNTNDPTWTGTSWSHFVDGQGNPVSVTAGDTTLMALTEYEYESSAIGSSPATRALDQAGRDAAEARLREGTSARFEVKKRVPIARRGSLSARRSLTSSARIGAAELAAIASVDPAREMVFANVRFPEAPPANDFYVRVFVGLPGAGPATPTSDPHYAGSFGFFGTQASDHHGHHHKTDFLVNVTGTLQRLRQARRLAPDSVSVQLVVVPVGAAASARRMELLVGEVDLIVTPATAPAR